MFVTITINRFVLLIATGSGQGPMHVYAWRECVFVLKQWWSLVEKAIRGPNTHDACTCSEYIYQLTGHWIRNRLVCSNLTVVE